MSIVLRSSQVKGITIAGKLCTTAEEMKERLQSLTREDFAKELVRINNDLLLAGEAYLSVLSTYATEVIKDGSEYNLVGDELKWFEDMNAQVREEGRKAFSTLRVIHKAKKNLQDALAKYGGERGSLIWNYIDAIEPTKGHGFYEQFAVLIRERKDSRLCIRLLNDFILEHAKSTHSYQRCGIRIADIKNAKSAKPSRTSDGSEYFKHQDFVAEELLRLELTITSCGLLDKGTYNDEVWPVCEDEDNLYPIVVSKESLPSVLDDSRPVLDTDDIAAVDSATHEALKIPGEGAQPSIRVPAATEPRTPETAKQPERTSTRKRNEPPVNYSKQGGKTPRSRNKLTPGGRVLSLPDCQCQEMPDSWKLLMTPNRPELSFEQLQEILIPVHELIHFDYGAFYGRPCLQHMKAASFLLYMYYEGLDIALLYQRFYEVYEVVKHRSSMHLAWVDPRTRAYFDAFRHEEVEQYRLHKTNPGKYRPLKASFTLGVQPATAPVIKPTRSKHGITIFEKMVDLPSGKTKELLLEDLRMNLFHCRDQDRTPDGLVRCMYHSLFMQVIRAHPLFWRLAVDLRKDHETRLICVPGPARVFRENDVVKDLWFEGDSGKLATTSALLDEVYFDGAPLKINYQGGDASEFDKVLGGNPPLKQFTRSTHPDIFDRILLETDNEFVLKEQAHPLSWHVRKSGTAVGFDLKVGSHPLVSFSLNYIAVGADGMCENGVHASVYEEAYRNLAAPKFGRFGEYVSDRAIDFNVRIEGLGAIGDSTTCRKPLDDSDVLIEKAAWLDFKNTPADRFVRKEWGENVGYQVKQAHRRLKTKEMALFPGHKSFFRCLEEKITAAPAPDDYIVITDSDDEVQQPTDDPFMDTPVKKPKGKAVRLSLSGTVLVGGKGKGKAVDQGPLDTENPMPTVEEEIIEEEGMQRAIRESLWENLREKTGEESSSMSPWLFCLVLRISSCRLDFIVTLGTSIKYSGTLVVGFLRLWDFVWVLVT